jgi:gliding motility-associated-like protein
MKKNYTPGWKTVVFLIIAFIQVNTEAYASHAQGGDLTYSCLGGNLYQLHLAFYRDCSGNAAPGSVSIDVNSASCGQNLNVTLYPIQGTGQDVTPICPQLQTVCNGGNNPGVQEWIYEGTITLPQACTDWIFSFTLCCRNAAINTIVNPGGQNIYIESHLDNLTAPCNNSPVFSNIPVPFVCAGQSYCFNHGAIDPDGDSLAYALVTPATGPGTFVTYISPYTASQPLLSSPAVSFNPQNGDICMFPTQTIVTVMAVRVEEWRNGILIGSVIRDIQLHTINCTNNLPYISGINNTNQFSLSACAGSTINFFINSFDVDAGQNITMTWNSGIGGATFTTTNAALPVGTFSWTPGPNNISNTPYCFTITVTDDACPYTGSQTFAFCITVTGFGLTMASTGTNCGASNGTASVVVNGGVGPYSYVWSPSGGNNANANGLTAGDYTVTVTDATGCMATDSVNVPQGPANGNIISSWTDIACFGGSTGTASVNVNGGQQPYTYAWSNGGNNSSINNLSAGTYTVLVTTANGCTTTATIIVTQPATALSTNASVNNPVSCFAGNNAQASVNANGGTGPYVYSWNSNPAQATDTATNLGAGIYAVVVTDANGCTSTASVNITQPQALLALTSATAVSCNGGGNGSAQVIASGGIGPYAINWNSTPPQFASTAVNLPAALYTVTVTDANGCTMSSTANVTQPAPLAATMNSIVDVSCNNGNNGTASVTINGGTAPYNYSWNTSPSQSTATAVNMTAGSFTATVTDANGCATVSTVTITQPAPVLIATFGTDTVCPGQATVISAVASGGVGTYTYNWTPALGPNNSYTVYPNALSNYFVTATDANGCTSTAGNVLLDVYQFSPANLTVSGNASICAGASTQIGATVTGNTGPVLWNWVNQIWNSGGPFLVQPNTTTTYQVNVTNICGVVVPGSVSVTVQALPVLALNPQQATGCDNIQLFFSDTTAVNAGCSYVWDYGDNTNTGAGSSTSHVYQNSGLFTVLVVITSPFGCIGNSNTQVSLTVYDSPVADFTVSTHETSELEPTIEFTSLCSGNTIGWNWDFGDATASTATNNTHTYAATGEYTARLIATSNGGCTDTTEQPIIINPEFTLYVPNAFTPNNDGTNDVFYAYGNQVTEFQMQVFDRWGNLIFASESLSLGWDGRANDGSEIAQQDVYVYKILVKDHHGKKHEYLGHVSLLD